VITGTLSHSEVIIDSSGNPVPIVSTRPILFQEQDFQATKGNHLQITDTGEYRYDHRILFYRGAESVVIGDQITIPGEIYTVVEIAPYASHKEIKLNACR
jgi:hypothetical protein